MKYYVYHAYGLSGELLYVGKGTGRRWRHCLCGTSHVRELNKYFFTNGEDGSVKVKIIEYFSDEREALLQEHQDILQLSPKFNYIKQSHLNSQTQTCNNLNIVEMVELNYHVSFEALMTTYTNAKKNNDHETSNRIDSKTSVCSRYYDALGGDRLQELRFNQNRINKEYRDSAIPDPTKEFDKFYLETTFDINPLLTEDTLKSVEKHIKDGRKLKLYALYTSTKKMTTKQMSEELGVSLRTTKYWLKEMREQGLIDEEI